MSAHQEIRVLIAASGSGGHLLPALWIADAIKNENPQAVVEFVGSGRPLEAKLIEPRGYRRHEIKQVGLVGRGVLGLLQFLVTLPGALCRTWSLLSHLKPQVVVGVGGYASVLPVLLAWLRGIPTWIHEAEVVGPGMANAFLSLFVTRASVVAPEAKLWRKRLEVTGHPVRPEIVQVGPVNTRSEGPRHLLILGGSQGAKALDDAMPQLVQFLRTKQIEVRHQTRPENVARLKAVYQEAGVKAEVESFIQDMVATYSWSDLIISRSGAASVNEISMINRPAIFVPLPSSQGGHQQYNANYLVRAGKAVLVEEGPQFSQRLEGALVKLSEPGTFSKMVSVSFAGRPRDAAQRIARGVLGLGVE